MQAQYSSIILFGGLGADRKAELYRAIADAGFEIVEEKVVSCASDSEPPLDRAIRLNEDQRANLQVLGVNHLSDFQYVTLRDAWRRLDSAQRGGMDFYHLCHRLRAAGLNFADVSLKTVFDYSADAWRAFGLDGATSGILMRHGVIGEQILVALTAEELATISGIGHGKRLANLVELQKKLRRPRAVS